MSSALAAQVLSMSVSLAFLSVSLSLSFVPVCLDCDSELFGLSEGEEGCYSTDTELRRGHSEKRDMIHTCSLHVYMLIGQAVLTHIYVTCS